MGKGQVKNELLVKDVVVLLKKIRVDRKLTLEDVYNDTGIHIARIESAKTNITLSTLHSLLNYYDIKMVDFFNQLNW
jgi:transcriptional regulator with XRE-family HTH domain